jgi:hypothetical protein
LKKSHENLRVLICDEILTENQGISIRLEETHVGLMEFFDFRLATDISSLLNFTLVLVGTYHVANGIQNPILHHEVARLRKLLKKLKDVSHIVRLEIIAI